MAAVAAIKIQCTGANACPMGRKYPRAVISTIHNTIPPMVPSQVFLGDMGEKGVLPIRLPEMYAMVSLIHMAKIVRTGKSGEKLLNIFGILSRSETKDIFGIVGARLSAAKVNSGILIYEIPTRK